MIKYIKENYRKMNKEEKKRISYILDEIFSDREIDLVLKGIILPEKYIERKSIDGIKVPQYGEQQKIHKLTYEQSFFGVKDNLQPIDTLVDKIKKRDIYKKFIANLSA